MDREVQLDSFNIREIGNTRSNKNLKICRLCGKESKHYFSIFEENDIYIPEKISRCLPIIISPNDNLPSNICKNCLLYLNISYKLILTSVKVDHYLRTQLDQKQKDVSKVQDDMASCKKSKICTLINTKMSLRELQKRALVGPAQCDLCDLKFQDVDAFDAHMEQFHFLEWRCDLCDKSFHKSDELIAHKIFIHNGNVVLCNNCEYTNDQNNKQKIHETNDQDMTIDQVQQEIINEKDKKESVIPLINKNMPATINLVMQTESKTFKTKTKNSPVQVSTGQSDVSSDSDTDRIINKWNGVLQRLRTLKPKEKEHFFCNSCKIRFGDERHFKAHNKIHEEKSITCTTCRIECSSMYELFLHKRSMHNMYKKVQLKYVCNKCGKFFTNSWHWETHNEDECSKMANKYCKYCDTVFSTHLKLIRHLRGHKSEMFSDPTVTVYKCVACPKIFVDKEFYEKHRNVHDPECWDKFKCTICNRPFRDKCRLREHQLAIHENTKPHSCDICGRSFMRLHNMKVHRAIHFGRKCSHCDADFRRRSELIKHIQDTHNLEPDELSNKLYTSGIYICKFCGKKLSTYQSLISHERIHTGEMPFSCSICHKAFRSYTSRWTHVQRHQKGTFVCEHCGKCFSYKQNLWVHIQTHLPMEDRKYECNFCGKKFLRNAHLTIHRRIHEGIRPFVCDVCSLSFTQKGDMKRHRLRHFKQNETKNMQSEKQI